MGKATYPSDPAWCVVSKAPSISFDDWLSTAPNLWSLRMVDSAWAAGERTSAPNACPAWPSAKGCKELSGVEPEALLSSRVHPFHELAATGHVLLTWGMLSVPLDWNVLSGFMKTSDQKGWKAGRSFRQSCPCADKPFGGLEEIALKGLSSSKQDATPDGLRPKNTEITIAKNTHRCTRGKFSWRGWGCMNLRKNSIWTTRTW